MRNYDDFPVIFTRVINKYNQSEKIKRRFGTEERLTMSEIHTIAAVGDHAGTNITALADVLGITKGAASQMIYKLVDKGMVEKKISPDSDAEVRLELTKKGKINYQAHEEFHRQANDQLFSSLKKMPGSSYDILLDALSSFEHYLDTRIEKAKK